MIKILYVNRIEETRVFITDTEDNVTEGIGYVKLTNYIRLKIISIVGADIIDDTLVLNKFKKNSIKINAMIGNELAIKLEEEFSDKNSIGLDSISMQSNKEVFWHCEKCGFDYKSSPNRRLHSDRHRGCPYCSGQQVKSGYNDVATTHPYILLDWDYDENSIKPTDYTAGSGVIAKFKCRICGCKYSSPISTRTRVDRETLGCPDCAARRNERGYSKNEKYIYDFLSKYYKCNDRVHLNKLEFDIYIPSLDVLIEYDGNHWHEFDYKIERDILKNKYAYENGFTLIRIRESNLKPLDNCINILMKDFDNRIDLVSEYLLNTIRRIRK